MSNICVYIEVPAYLRQYLYHHFGDPVVFDRNLPQNKLIKLLINKQPRDSVPEFPSEESVSVAIPDQPYKPAENWNYLSPDAKKALVESIKNTFDVHLFQDLQKILPLGVNLLTAIRSWMRNNGIDIEYDLTIRQKYYRVRDAFEKAGIDLKRDRRFSD